MGTSLFSLIHGSNTDFFKWIESRIISYDCEWKSLLAAQAYGSILSNIDVGIYDSPCIEKILIKKFYSLFLARNEIFECVAHNKDCLHIISEPYLTGGHTRLMEKLAQMHLSPVDLLIVRDSDVMTRKRVANYFDLVIDLGCLTGMDKFISFIHHAAKYKKIVLHIHPDDIFSVVACGVLKKLNPSIVFYFVNHADHTFSFGTTIADFYFEISAYGARLDAKKEISACKTFLGIPCFSNFDSLPNMRFRELSTDEPLIFFSAGSAVKYKPVTGFGIFPLVDQVLSNFSQSKFIVVGVNGFINYWWWISKLKYGSRLILQKSMPYEEYCKTLSQADIYIDSYPLTGGTAFVEQLSTGKICSGLRSPVQGYSPADELKYDTCNEVINSLLAGSDWSTTASKILDVNSLEAVKERYLSCLYDGIIYSNKNEEYLQWSGDLNFFIKKHNKIDGALSATDFLRFLKIDARVSIMVFLKMTLMSRVFVCIRCIRYFFVFFCTKKP